MAVDYYSLFADDESAARMQAKALSDALRTKEGLARLNMLSGDKVLVPMGQAYQQDAGRDQGQLVNAGLQRGAARLRQLMAKEARELQGQRDRDERAWDEKKQGALFQQQKDLEGLRFSNQKEMEGVEFQNQKALERLRASLKPKDGGDGLNDLLKLFTIQGKLGELSGEPTPKEVRQATVPGREIAEGAFPSATDKETVLKSDTTGEALKASLQALEDATKNAGLSGRIFNDEALTTAHQLASDQYRVLAGLGAPSGPDARLMQRALADPTAWKSILMGREGEGSRQKLLEAVDRMTDQVATMRGYKPRKGAAPPDPAAGAGQVAAPAQGDGKITVSDGKEFLQIDPEDLAAAEADGFKRVK